MNTESIRLASPAVLDSSPHPRLFGGSKDAQPSAETWRLVDDRWEPGPDLPVSLRSPRVRLVNGRIALVGRSAECAHHLWLDAVTLEVQSRVDFDSVWLDRPHWLDGRGRVLTILDEVSLARLQERAGRPPSVLDVASPPSDSPSTFDALERADGWIAWAFGTPDRPGENDVWRRVHDGWERIAVLPVGRTGICRGLAWSSSVTLFVRTDGRLHRLDESHRVSSVGSLEPSDDPDAFWGGVAVALDGSRLYGLRAGVARCCDLDSPDEPTRELLPPEHERFDAQLLRRPDGSYWVVGGFAHDREGRPPERWHPRAADAAWMAERQRARAEASAAAERARATESAVDWLTTGAPVRIVKGPYAGSRGTVGRVTGSTVHVDIRIFGRAATTQVPADHVAPGDSE